MTASVTDWKVPELEEYVGGLSNPSKMPGFSYGLPAEDCLTGGRLRTVEGSTCSGCYAHKGAYSWPMVKAAYRRRADSLERPLWVEAMVELLERKRRGSRADGRYVFRWHDSGDLQSVTHLERIVRVCERTPEISHWIPTREYRIVSEYVAAGGTFPPNLSVRLSAHMIGGRVPTFPRLAGVAGVSISTVSADPGTYPDAHECPSRHQNGKCGDCRACWNPDVAHVDYHLH